MKIKQISVIIILSCMLFLSSCSQYEDEIEYTYPEYPLEEETTIIDNQYKENSEITSESAITESITDNEEEDKTEAVETGSVNTEDSNSENPETEVSETYESATIIETEPQETESHIEELETETVSPHTDTLDENGYCDICGEKILDDIPNENESTANTEEASEEEVSEEVTELTTTAQYALFDKFYDSNFDINETKHSNGGKMTEKSDTYIANGYMLKFLNYANVYKNARDAKGNPALKVGKTDAVGAFEIQIPANISTVVFKVAKYKDHASSIIINGVQYVLTKNSDDGEYDVITVDTKENKIIKFTTADAYKVCMIRSIEFIK